MAPAPTSTTTITPPSSSHDFQNSWGYPENHKEGPDYDISTTTTHEHTHKRHHATQNGYSTYHPGSESTTRKMISNDNSADERSGRPVDAGRTSSHGHELKMSPNPNDNTWAPAHQNGDEHKRNPAHPTDVTPGDENSKWIHRDKLARIESEELQAAGIFIPRTRAPSKQRRDRSRSAMRRGTDASEPSHNRSRKNSAVVEPRAVEHAVESWDLRTPEEIAEEEANAYFASTSVKSGSRIPVAKTSPAPIPADYLERGVLAARKPSDSPEGDTLSYQRTRSRSVSMKGSDATTASSILPAAKRSVTDSSPKKNTTGLRKTSGPSKAGTTGRPKTRSGSNKESNGSIATRPSTRSGELSPGNKAPEGDPPWLVNTYKPDPRLPPDQQLLPTVARRLQQEKWEKEGKFGDVYDKEFRPLNDNAFLKPPEPEKSPSAEEENQQQSDEWPLRVETTKSPRQGSYSTMPKISDKPLLSPLPSPRTPMTPHALEQEQTTSRPEPKAPERQPQEPAEDTKDGCGCCIVM
ncbi:Fc.00g075610.m01.CDS01 [Cosmosporella sp. VM-42]